jgi:5-methylcytosine-specific restriction endonuclease McrA
MSRNRPYSSSAWQRTRRAILARDGGICMIKGPRCTGIATTVDHIIPSSQGGPFWDPANLRASCERCNYARSSSVAAANTRTKMAEMLAIIDQQAQEIEQLREQLRRLERPAQPAIH